jgi:hypothetical protein
VGVGVVVVVVMVVVVVVVVVVVIVLVIIGFYFFLLSLKRYLPFFWAIFFWFYRKHDLGTKNVFHLNIIFLCLVGSKEKGCTLVRQGQDVLKEVGLACHFTDRGPDNFGINQYRKVSKWLVVRAVGNGQWAEPRWLVAQTVCCCWVVGEMSASKEYV